MGLIANKNNSSADRLLTRLYREKVSSLGAIDKANLAYPELRSRLSS